MPVGESGYRDVDASGDEEGRFAVSGLLADADYLVVFSNQQRTLMAALSVTAPADKKSAAVEVKLLPAASVSGRVLDEDNKPISGALVQVYTPWTHNSKRPTSEALTAADGCFKVLHVLPDQEIFVAASAEGYMPANSGQLRATSGKDHAVDDLVLQKRP